MSLSERGKQRLKVVSPEGPMYNFLRGITHEWREDFPEGICQLDVSENDLMEDELSQIFRELISQGNSQIVTMSGAMWPCSSQKLLDAGCLVFNTHFNPRVPVISSQMVAGAGCSLLLEAIARVICDPEDIILSPAPYWPVFSWLVGKAEVAISTIPAVRLSDANYASNDLEALLTWSEEIERAWESHIQGLERRPKGRPKALLLSNPQNPLGRCYSQGFLEGALKFCQKHDLFMISDEVFALSMHADNSVQRFTSILSIDLQSQNICDPERIITLWSVSKDIGTSGSRVAFAVTPKELPDLRNALMSIAPSFRVSSLADNFFSDFFTAPYSSISSCTGFGRGSSLMDNDAGSLLSWYVSRNRQKLSESKRQLQVWCDQRGLRYLDGDAGNFLMINLEPVIRRRSSDTDMELDKSFHSHLLSEGVALQPGYSTMFPGFGWARVTFSRRMSYMEEGLSRLDRALSSWK